MATDATGTPTSPDSIPTYNVNVDDPTGNGFNNAMTAIQNIVTALKAGTLASGKIAIAALTGYPADVTKFLRGDGTWTPTPGQELAYVESTVSATTAITSQASATTLLTAPSITFDGSTKIKIEFYAESVYSSIANTASVVFNLWEDSTDKGFFGRAFSANTNQGSPFVAIREYTPTAGAKIISVRFWNGAAATAHVDAGTGTGGEAPMFLRITRAS